METPGQAEAPRSVEERITSLLDAEELEEDEVVQDDQEEPLDQDDVEDEDYEEDEGPEDEPVEEEPSDQDPLYTVKVDGEEIQVDEEELLRGYSRHADYTRKTQALSERAHQLTSLEAELVTERQQYAGLLGQLRDTVTRLSGDMTPEQWDTLKKEDPYTWQMKVTEQQLREKQLRAAEEELSLVQHREMERQQRLMSEQIETEQAKLLETFPSWKDPDTRSQEQRKMVQYAMEVLGFSREDLAGVVDHRIIKLLKQGLEFHELQEKGKKLKGKQRGAPAVRPGTRERSPKPKRQRRFNEAKAKVADSGSVDDAARAIMHMIPD